MQAGSSAADEDKLASEEIESVWNFISSRLFDMEVGNAKEKVRFDV